MDSTVLVSAILFRRSVPRQLADVVFARTTVLRSTDTTYQLLEVVGHEKFDKPRYPPPDQRRLAARLLLDAMVLTVVTERISVCRDPGDDMFLELAVSGRADVIVTGDNDLLALHPFRGIAILTPADFLQQLTR